MALRPCRDCGREVSENAWRCPACGATLRGGDRARYAAALVLFLFAAGMILYFGGAELAWW